MGGLCGEYECVYGGRRRESGGSGRDLVIFQSIIQHLEGKYGKFFFSSSSLQLPLFFIFHFWTSSLSFRPPEM